MNGEAGFGLTGSGAEPLEHDDPRRIGPIPLLGRLGAGGMGRVYLGVHEGRYATGGCPDLHRRASMIGLTTTTCTGSASQRWTRI